MPATIVQWEIIYTRPHYERRVSQALSGRGIEVYLPLLLIRKKWRDRVKYLECPLFPNYLFVNITPAHYNEVFTVTGVVKYVSFEGKHAVVSPRELNAIRILVEIQHDFVKGNKQRIYSTENLYPTDIMAELRNGTLQQLEVGFPKI
ncbi:UpxY family transcription antiterminator [Chitinophaga nivalis]|uniref:UpxY family transcription antiterminator n=1 Tax=Chitinophaga nivalis TaxID=2991709 RepID=A0ABT3IJC6_9BACT|nr:UpxY family transcription antiterminator [Chitinophaga nivalis]MCW3466243.1 UpxY family transcription antiterminator [Chitinophaga nivalis]MCW3484066.1 UpxY family transcription antiterminator [Chitinophaga nivalis]